MYMPAPCNCAVFDVKLLLFKFAVPEYRKKAPPLRLALLATKLDAPILAVDWGATNTAPPWPFGAELRTNNVELMLTNEFYSTYTAPPLNYAKLLLKIRRIYYCCCIKCKVKCPPL